MLGDQRYDGAVVQQQGNNGSTSMEYRLQGGEHTGREIHGRPCRAAFVLELEIWKSTGTSEV